MKNIYSNFRELKTWVGDFANSMYLNSGSKKIVEDVQTNIIPQLSNWRANKSKTPFTIFYYRTGAFCSNDAVENLLTEHKKDMTYKTSIAYDEAGNLYEETLHINDDVDYKYY